MSEIITQVEWELDSFLAYVKKPNPDKRERGFELDIMQTLKLSIERKLDALMEFAQGDEE